MIFDDEFGFELGSDWYKCPFNKDPDICTCSTCFLHNEMKRGQDQLKAAWDRNSGRDGTVFGVMKAPEPPPKEKETPRDKYERQRQERILEARQSQVGAVSNIPSYGNDPEFIKGYVEHTKNRDLSGPLSLTPLGSAADTFNAAKEFITNPSVGAAAMIVAAAVPGKLEKVIPDKAKKVFQTKIEWQATREKGTHFNYVVHQRNDVNWNQTRTSGDKRYIGKTNAEAAEKGGLPPQLPDGNFATLHHLGQKRTGPLVEASTKYHGVGKPGQDALHSQYGRSKPHPTLQPDRKKFSVDDREYWKTRTKD
ncbi:HNH/ENDO VII family nuclease [Vibrio rotiferianus]|uniref:HNH/ENDO VII family nuclease n=1 Tax=Vibrio rotiferianus TaxID=190895 RepID=UPI0003A560E9|nr:HNH/ENDO VII family nuclease [Vibrio rotiferianus]PIB16383.1 hypothetical protein B853_11559 [Vibrio rotiferianus CAIM 577 = LMG 21460]